MFYKSNNYDWNTAAVWITLAISIITPTISLIMSNIHQRKLKKLELKHSIELESYYQMEKTFKNFLENVSSKLHLMGSYSKDYELAYHELFLYVPKEYWHKLKEFDKVLLSSSSNIDNVQKHYLEVTEILAFLLQEKRRQIPT